MANKDNIVAFPDRNGPAARRLIPSRLRDARLAQCLNQTELAAHIGVTRQAISAFEQGEISPEPDKMARIARALDQPLSYFISEDSEGFGASSIKFFRAFGPATKRRNLACEVLGKWFAQIVRYFDRHVNYPPITLPSLSPASADGTYLAEEIEEAAEECRRVWGLGVGPISNVVALLENKGISTCRYEISGESIEAFSFWSGPRAFVFLASDKEAGCRSRFDAVHELAHLILHRWAGADDLENPKRLRIIEREANRFAGAFLLPRKSFPNEVYTTRLDAFIELKRRWKVAIQAMVYRCKDLGIFDEDQVTNLYKQISARRWKAKEPLDNLVDMPLEQPKLLARAASLLIEGAKKMPDEVCSEIRIERRLIERFCNLSPGYLASNAEIEFTPTLK